jgi:hypothetical protein
MADQYGAITLPATATDDFVDPLTYYLGHYLKAALTAQLLEKWQQLAPGKDLVRSVFTADPAEVLFNESALPALFCWRPISEHSTEKVADDYHVTISMVRVFWLQAHDTSPKRERRMQFSGLLSKATHSALVEGRHPDWVVAGDTDATAATRGSLLMKWAGLLRPPEVRSETLPVTMQVDGGEPVTYQAVIFSVKCAERLTRSVLNRSGRNPTITAKLDLTVDQDGHTVESLIPTT